MITLNNKLFSLVTPFLLIRPAVSWSRRADVEVTVVHRDHIDVVEKIAVEVAFGSRLDKPDVDQRGAVEHIRLYLRHRFRIANSSSAILVGTILARGFVAYSFRSTC